MVNPILLLRVIQGVLALIVLGVAAYVVDSFGGTSDAANFLVFDAVWTFIALGYVVVTPMFFPNFHNRWAVLGVEAITMVFWFAGFIALAVNINQMICRQGLRLHLALLNGKFLPSHNSCNGQRRERNK
ncbi:marvel domain-containing protein [Tuber borchii]|uniref:Marvel domain-containing protein n=1 Tax=Tuber borchii TaxID=42251 RepID=A0A2T6ZZJ5_TUBBO|nr:marvel domain-containing protein [Tuber borchii]